MYFVKSEYVVHVLSRDTGRGAGRVIYFAYKSMCNATFTEQRCLMIQLTCSLQVMFHQCIRRGKMECTMCKHEVYIPF